MPLLATWAVFNRHIGAMAPLPASLRIPGIEEMYNRLRTGTAKRGLFL